jgi:hypothetical protein
MNRVSKDSTDKGIIRREGGRKLDKWAIIKKSRHQKPRGTVNKLPEATGAHGATQIPLEGAQGVMPISTG